MKKIMALVMISGLGVFAALGVAGLHAQASVSTAPADDCGVVSCTIFLPIIANPMPPLPAQFEVTQGVQQPDNSVLLVANRPAYVRWTLTSNVADANVNAYLYGTRGGVSLSGSPLAAINNSRTLQPSANRAILDDTFNFQLPLDWTAGDVVLSAQALNPTDFFTYTTAAGFHFNPSAAMQVKMVPIAYQCTSGGSGTTTPDGPYDYLIDYTYRAYPVPSIALSTHSSIPYNGPCNSSGVPKPWSQTNPSDISHWENMLDAVTSVWTSEGRPDIYYYGLVKIDCGGGCIAGIGWLGRSRAAVGFDGFGTLHYGASETHAHEVGHNHGRDHIPFNPNDPTCLDPGDTDPSYPYVNGVIGDGAHQNFGFDINSPAVLPYYWPYYDIMNYCQTQWISDYTYEGIWEYDNVVLAQRSLQPIGAHSFLISGAIDSRADRASFNPVYAIDMPAHPPERSERGDYVLDLLDANRHVIASYPFAAASAQPDRFAAPDRAEETIGFHLILPYRADVTALRVRRGNHVLGTLDASSTAPLLRPVSPRFGISRTGQIEWSGVSANGEPLSYLVRASTDDGKTWETIAVDLTNSAITLSSDDFGGQVVRLQVIGSNGLQSSTLAMGPYRVPGK